MKKNSCTPINPKKYSCHGLKKNHTRNLITKKIPDARKFPTPSPITFLMARPLERSCTKGEDKKSTGVGGRKEQGKSPAPQSDFNYVIHCKSQPRPQGFSLKKALGTRLGKSERSFSALKMGPLRCVEYRPILSLIRLP